MRFVNRGRREELPLLLLVSLSFHFSSEFNLLIYNKMRSAAAHPEKKKKDGNWVKGVFIGEVWWCRGGGAVWNEYYCRFFCLVQFVMWSGWTERSPRVSEDQGGGGIHDCHCFYHVQWLKQESPVVLAVIAVDNRMVGVTNYKNGLHNMASEPSLRIET